MSAARYAERGWPVFPCNGKVPLTEHGMLDATTDPRQVEEWWRQWPGANVAIATGAGSGLVVLDVDGDEGTESLRRLERDHGDLPRMWSVVTPSGGQHFYFRHPGREVPSSAGKLGPGLDIRADGGYVIAPPSTGYEVDEEGPIAPLPGWLQTMISTPSGPAPKADQDIPVGRRNATLTSYAGTMRRPGIGEAAIRAALIVENRDRCRPPLPEAEVERIAASVARYEPARTAVTPTKLRRLDVGRMVREQPPPVPWTVEGLAIAGCLTLLTGREGEGKSLLAQAVARGVALGEDVAGLDCRQGLALIVDAENGEAEIHRRVHTLGLPADGVEVFEADGFHLGRNLDELMALIGAIRPTLIVLDSYRSLWPGGDENDPAAVAAALDPLRNLIRSEGASAILLHHLPKAARANYRGTTAIGAAVELGFKLSRSDDDPEATDRRRLDCFKCRPAPEPDRRWLRLHIERGQVFVERAKPYQPEGEPERRQPVRSGLAPEMLAAAATPITWADLARAINRKPNDGTARRLRDDLLARGELRELADDRLQVVGVPSGARVPSGVGTPDSGSIKPDSARVPGCQHPIGGAADGTLDHELVERAAELGISPYDDGGWR